MLAECQNIMIVAGEASGDMHGAALVTALKRLRPSWRFYGVGGRKLREAGVELLADSADMAVVGLTEVLFKLPHIRKVLHALTDSWQDRKPAAVILIDYPDFNLVLARKAHARGIKVFYYISPQVWAWRKGRIRTIRRVVERMAVILPFEEALYRQAGVNATFVGHPLLDQVPRAPSQEEARDRIGLRSGLRTVALLPGSRPNEAARLLPVLLGAATELMRQGDIQFVMPLASTLSREYVTRILNAYPIDVAVVSQAVYDVLAASDMAIVASGTATLEAALMETPMVIIYRVSWLSYLLGRMFIQVKNIGLVNIIAGKTIVPELIQWQANPERIAEVAASLLNDPDKRARMKSALSGIRAQLGFPGAAERVARLLDGAL